jgi:hypothetical protein
MSVAWNPSDPWTLATAIALAVWSGVTLWRACRV